MTVCGDISALRAVACGAADWACNDVLGVDEASPRFQRVTERRQVGFAAYSSCGDLAHWVLWCCGLRDPSIVNRAENNSYTVGWNVAKLTRLAHVAGTTTDLRSMMPGDFGIIWNRQDTTDAHVFVVRAPYDAAQHQLATWDYGQGSFVDNRLLRGCRNLRGISFEAGRAVIGSRKLQCIVSLGDLLGYDLQEPMTMPPDGAANGPPKRRTLRLTKPYMRGDDVREMQSAVEAAIDGLEDAIPLDVDSVFGPDTDYALRIFQASNGLLADGVCGPKTWAVIDGLAR